ncbi:MAG: S46 family peptidase, partial [Terriglobales bacterium]
MTRRWLLAVSLCALLLTAAKADEGMWLFNAVPRDKIKDAYGFEPSQEWLDHVRLSSVRFNNGGSGSFVSADGLTFTNHHVASECIHQLSSENKDLLKSGYYARTRAEEAKCPDLELNVLQDLEDVTARVNAGVKPKMSAAELGQAQRAAMSAIEKDCTASTGLRCDIVTLYAGGAYHLYKYKKYTDVRLVFAPESDIAFFGGDPDNFNFPRYDLDTAFFRVYENDKPATTPHHLKWSKTGVKEGDLIFVSGHPGSTGRLKTMAELEFLRDVHYPFLLKSYQRRIALHKKFAAASAENARIAADNIQSLENSFKAVSGYQAGLNDEWLMGARQAEEDELRAGSNKDLETALKETEKAMATHRQIYLPYMFLERTSAAGAPGGFRGELGFLARRLVRTAAERARPNEQRLREYRDSALPSLEQALFSTAPVYKSLETAILADSLAEMRDHMGAGSVTIERILKGKDPAEVAREAIASTRLDDVAVRRQFYEGGAKAIEKSEDPLIVLLRNVEREARAARKTYDDEVDSVTRRYGAVIAQARFAAHGTARPPDATFTLRLSYGAVRGYTENNKLVPYFTTLGGTYQHAAAHGNQPPWQLPESWTKNKRKLLLRTPFNFVSTPDIIGGSSGSPVVDKGGQLVGIIFDG